MSPNNGRWENPDLPLNPENLYLRDCVLDENEKGPCPSETLLAALAENRVSKPQQQALFHHLSRCSHCLNTYQLLHSLTRVPKKSRIFSPLPLAASVLIIAFTVFILLHNRFAEVFEPTAVSEPAPSGKVLDESAQKPSGAPSLKSSKTAGKEKNSVQAGTAVKRAAPPRHKELLKADISAESERITPRLPSEKISAAEKSGGKQHKKIRQQKRAFYTESEWPVRPTAASPPEGSKKSPRKIIFSPLPHRPEQFLLIAGAESFRARLHIDSFGNVKKVIPVKGSGPIPENLTAFIKKWKFAARKNEAEKTPDLIEILLLWKKTGWEIYFTFHQVSG